MCVCMCVCVFIHTWGGVRFGLSRDVKKNIFSHVITMGKMHMLDGWMD